jgi:MprA protease rhombosortase-interaction domain-containing protein
VSERSFEPISALLLLGIGRLCRRRRVLISVLALAARKRFVVDRYEDAAVGYMEKNEEGKLAITRVVLHPRVTFEGSSVVSNNELDRFHRLAHEHCFIANSVRTRITIGVE